MLLDHLLFYWYVVALIQAASQLLSDILRRFLSSIKHILTLRTVSKLFRSKALEILKKFFIIFSDCKLF